MSNIPKKLPEHRHPGVAIDDGFRAWYESCPCCLSESHPEVKRALDDEQLIRAAEDAAKVAPSSRRGAGSAGDLELGLRLASARYE